MPTYEYECENCGPFTEIHPMAEFDQPQPCPDCGTAAPRLLTLPAIGAGGGGAAMQDNSAASIRAHPGGCGCCAAPRRFSADAV